ncbi:MAG: hypothetical protein M3P51_08955 [Chloroflexota bacterium]|nr:hypothetical protein [Chloroflexota bacterium]
MTETQTKPRLEGADTTVMSLRLRADELQALQEIAGQLNIKLSAVVHMAIAELARKHKVKLGGR